MADAIHKLRVAAPESSNPIEAAFLSQLANRFQARLKRLANGGALPTPCRIRPLNPNSWARGRLAPLRTARSTNDKIVAAWDPRPEHLRGSRKCPRAGVAGVRVPPGEEGTVAYTHTWLLRSWCISAASFSASYAGREKDAAEAELKEMRVAFDPSSQPLHSVENLGSFAYQAYRVELKPTTKVALATPFR